MMFVKKWPFEYQKEIETYLSTYPWDSNDISDSRNSSDSSDGSVVTVVTILNENLVTKILWL